MAAERSLRKRTEGLVARGVDRVVDTALQSETVERTAEKVLDSEMLDRLWRRLLASNEAQQLVERVAEAPEVRSAITSQGVGLLEDMRRSLRRAARRLDDHLDATARRLFRFKQRTARPIYAGGVTRLIALALDAAILNGILLALSAAIALIVNAFSSGDQSAGAVTIAFGAFAWIVSAVLYLTIFWALAERTPGMTFLGLRILTEEGGPVPPRRALRRVVGLVLAAIPAGLGFLGVLLDDRRRGWQDRFADTVVLYADPELDLPDQRRAAPASH
jgi:uncharacterized RDD family membrane protein YckC